MSVFSLVGVVSARRIVSAVRFTSVRIVVSAVCVASVVGVASARRVLSAVRFASVVGVVFACVTGVPKAVVSAIIVKMYIRFFLIFYLVKKSGLTVYRIIPERINTAIADNDWIILAFAFVTFSGSPPAKDI